MVLLVGAESRRLTRRRNAASGKGFELCRTPTAENEFHFQDADAILSAHAAEAHR
jgi:hypothetical protein